MVDFYLNVEGYIHRYNYLEMLWCLTTVKTLILLMTAIEIKSWESTKSTILAPETNFPNNLNKRLDNEWWVMIEGRGFG